MGERLERFKNWIGTDTVPFQSPLARMSDRVDEARQSREQKDEDDDHESEGSGSEQDEGSSE